MHQRFALIAKQMLVTINCGTELPFKFLCPDFMLMSRNLELYDELQGLKFEFLFINELRS